MADEDPLRVTLSGPLDSPSIPIPVPVIDTQGHLGISAYDFRILSLVSAAYEYLHNEYGCSPASTSLHVEHQGEESSQFWSFFVNG